jgi:hypothetical protein
MSNQVAPELNNHSSSPDVQAPEFGDVAHLPEACGPRDLYCRLQDIEENVHYIEPAFRFASAALQSPGLASWTYDCSGGSGAELLEQLLGRACDDLSARPTKGYATSWPTRIAREFAPLGLVDGVWLQGLVQFGLVESEAGMAALAQLMIRFAGPGIGEAYAQRYAALLRSLGIVPASFTRWEAEADALCAPISYEHALLGACLALFPGTFTAETAGFNLWMAAIGPCLLLDNLVGELRPQVTVSYFDGYDRKRLAELAKKGALALIAGEHEDTRERRTRIARGFAAAHRSYKRWEQAMLGGSIPRTPRDFVLEMISRKARFAIGHHMGRHLRGRKGETADLEALFAGDRADHAALLDHLADSSLIRAGAPDDSPFLTRSLSFGGPMFDVFTQSEERDLREWIDSLGEQCGASVEPGEPIELEGVYSPPQDPDSLRAYAIEYYGQCSAPELAYRLLNADRYPAVRVFARFVVSNALAVLADALDNDARLDSATQPPYSEKMLAEMVEANHARNIRTRSRNVHESHREDKPVNASAAEAADTIVPERYDHAGAAPGAPLDGCWLGGFADVQRINLEDYGLLFRIYAGELGDGQLDRNHNYILRRMNIERGTPAAEALLPLWDRRLYDVVSVSLAEIIMIALSLNTRFFLPDVLGVNLFVEAKGVGGYYLTAMNYAERVGHRWTALSMRIHNSIDNYATGHTKWAVAAIQAFMARVRDVLPPAAQEEQWRRIWRLWRFNEIHDFGSDEERKALSERLGSLATASFVPSEL